ncbi:MULTISPECIES: LexA family protein [unclassified Methylophaga]|uniref:LexA family protein n=1 Tax=unclassified Methylophaga TaxID=2629249 RepID=UPI000C98D6B0|nr:MULTISPECIES: translesion error-prone DNA polymerase V autoproteolytic subunit [unclassified Methylophaga]MBN47828.1 peptidase S24 [Methylophaga sp.]|tara:strand:+ start:69460 stop:70083 length:624 start_codon:yes stop_codon:yes gene_type:complete
MTIRSNTHGGRRAGAGRKKGSAIKEPTTVMRIPQSQKPVIADFLKAYRRYQSTQNQSPHMVDEPTVFERPVITPAKRSWPLFSSKVAAGFPSPADEHVEKRLDPNEFLIDDEEATFFVTIQGYSMIDSGLLPGDKAVVNRAKNASIGDIVLAVVDGEFTIKLLAKTKEGDPRLLPSNQSGEYQPIEIKDGMQFEIWGVVTGSFRRFK